MITPTAALSPAFDPPLTSALGGRQQAFLDALGRARATDPAPVDQARDTAEKFVAMAFIQPLLKDLRNASWAAPPFSPTPAERSFRALTDAQLAQDLVRTGRWPLVDRLARDLRSRSQAGPGPEGPTP